MPLPRGRHGAPASPAEFHPRLRGGGAAFELHQGLRRASSPRAPSAATSPAWRPSWRRSSSSVAIARSSSRPRVPSISAPCATPSIVSTMPPSRSSPLLMRSRSASSCRPPSPSDGSCRASRASMPSTAPSMCRSPPPTTPSTSTARTSTWRSIPAPSHRRAWSAAGSSARRCCRCAVLPCWRRSANSRSPRISPGTSCSARCIARTTGRNGWHPPACAASTAIAASSWRIPASPIRRPSTASASPWRRSC